MKTDEIRDILKDYGLKVTPQRVAVYDALCTLEHPYADDIVDYVRQSNPGISVATIYNTLDHFKEKELLFKLETCKDKMRYDAGMHRHYHICDTEKDRIIDYQDEELQALIQEYFTKKEIRNVKVKDIRLLIMGSIKD